MKTGEETIETMITKNQDPNVNLRLNLRESLRKNSMVKTLNRSQLSEKPSAKARQALPAYFAALYFKIQCLDFKSRTVEKECNDGKVNRICSVELLCEK